MWQAPEMLWTLREEWDLDLHSGDPLTFPGYGERLAELDGESVRTGLVDTGIRAFVLIEGDFAVIGGSMGLVHGEKVVRALDRAVDRRLPVVVVTRSGGARMQEGMVSLIQMGRTAAAIRRHSRAGLLSISVHRSPTTGGVFASYGSLTDLRVVEAGATIGFAGPRVVEQTAGGSVEGRSHSAETAYTAGLVDAVVVEDDLVSWVETALGFTDTPLPASDGADTGPTSVRQQRGDGASGHRTDLGAQIAIDGEADPDPGDGEKPDDGAAAIGNPAWAAVLAARSPERPSGIQIAAALVASWTELRGGVDSTLRCGLARIGDHRVVVVATDRHADSGQPGPIGFRKAQRAVALAGRLGLPIVSLVDTPGADPRPDAENDGIAAEIAATFAAYAEAPVPTVAVCVGEGGSGGALALAVADRFFVQQTAIFSVIGPEGAAAILERDATRAPEVAPRLRLRSSDLMDLGIVDAVVSDDPDTTAAAVRTTLDELTGPDLADVGQWRLTRWDEATSHWLG